MDALGIILIGITACLTLYWQYRIASPENDLYELIYLWDIESPNKFTWPFYFGVTIIIGSIIYGIIALVQGTSDYINSLYAYINLIMRCIVFAIILIVKTYFGPLVLGYVVSASIYFWFEDGELHLLPVFEQLLDWVFFSVSKPVHVLYTVLVGGYALKSNLHELHEVQS